MRLAAQICAVPISLISFVLADRQWFKAETGLGVRETKLESSVCRHLLLSPGLTQIPDLRDDPRSADNPLVTEQAGLRFYAGYLLTTPEGVPLGSLCVLDREPRPAGLSPEQQFALTVLARHLSGLLELQTRPAPAAAPDRAERDPVPGDESPSGQQPADGGEPPAAAIRRRVQGRRRTGPARRGPQPRPGDRHAARTALPLARGERDRAWRLSRRVVETVASLAAVEATVETATPIMLPTERAVAAALIANELVTNAVKHAAPAHAALFIQVTVDAHADASLLDRRGRQRRGPAGRLRL